MPRPYATLSPDQPLEIVVEHRGGGRALVRGTLRRVPLMAGGEAMRIELVDATAVPLPDAESDAAAAKP